MPIGVPAVAQQAPNAPAAPLLAGQAAPDDPPVGAPAGIAVGDGPLRRPDSFSSPVDKKALHETLEGDIRVKVVSIDFLARPDLNTVMHIFIPSTSPYANKEGRVPTVCIAPGGSSLFTGKSPARSDYAECLPWANAGFGVVLYSLAGSPDGLRHEPTEAEINACFQKFRQSEGGLKNFDRAKAAWMDAEQLDHDRLIVVGHSSASTLALLIAESEHQIDACIIFDAVTDVAASLGANLVPLDAKYPGLADFARHFSPERYVKDLHCPLFVFHAEDDKVAPINRVAQFASRAREYSPNVEFVRVPTGGHGDSMISRGIPQAIKWVSDLDFLHPERANLAGRMPNQQVAPDRDVQPKPRRGPNGQPDAGAIGGDKPDDFDRREKPESKLTDWIKGALIWHRTSVPDLVAARLIVGDNKRIAAAPRRCPALDRPVTSLRFLLGASGLDERSFDSRDQGAAIRDFRKGGGDFANWLLEGMLGRTAAGSFGQWASEINPHERGIPNSALLANDATDDGLQLTASNLKADVLVSLNFTSKAAGKKKRIVTLVIRITDVARNSELWASKPLSSTALQAGRAKGNDPGVELINDALAYIDENLALRACRIARLRRRATKGQRTSRGRVSINAGQTRRVAGVSVPEVAHRRAGDPVLRQIARRGPRRATGFRRSDAPF